MNGIKQFGRLTIFVAEPLQCDGNRLSFLERRFAEGWKEVLGKGEAAKQ